MKIKIILFVLLSFAFFNVHPQSVRSSSSILKNNNKIGNAVNPDHVLFLDANFLAMKVFGDAPLTVQFKDISSGEPTSWTWNFGDGGESNVKHPLYTYQEPGVFTVKLTVSDGVNSNTETKTAFIVVQPAGLCDSLGYPLQGDYIFYTILGENSGYVSGNNSFADLAKASYFYDYEAGSQFVAGIFDFAIATRLTTNDAEIKFKVWDNDGSFNKPGTVLDSVLIKISDIVQNVDFGQSTVVMFPKPVVLNGPFFIGVELPQILGDTLVLYTNENGNVPVGNGWEQQNTGDWFPYSDEISSWAIDIDHAIFPVVCQSTGINNQLISENMLVYPNPTSSIINIAFLHQPEKDMEIRLTDLTGRIVAFGNIFGNQAKIDVSQLSAGTFFLSLISSENVITRKIVVER